MSIPVSFFRNHTTDHGQTLELSLAREAGPVELGIYSRSPLSTAALSHLQNGRSGSAQDYAAFRQRLSSDLRRAGGGMIVEVQAARSVVSIDKVPGGNGFQSSSRMLMIRPGYPARFYGYESSEGVELRPGCHVLLPVDAEAQQRLQTLTDDLRWLSPDIEALVLNTISQPSLEARLDRLEDRLGGGRKRLDAFSVAASRTSGFGKLLAWFRKPLPLGPVLALLLALLVAGNLVGNTVLAQRFSATVSSEISRLESRVPQPVPSPSPEAESLDIPNPEDTSPELTTAPVEASVAEVGADDPADQVELPQAVDQLMAILARFPVDSPEGRVYAAHFQPHLGPDVLRQEDAGYGFIKLVALGKREALDDAVLRQDGHSATKRLLQNLRRRLEPSESRLLAHVTCLAFADNREENIAGLPFVERHTLKRRVVLPVACDGDISKPEVAVRGMIDLESDFAKRLGDLPSQAPSDPSAGE